jgi:hypothetical protein
MILVPMISAQPVKFVPMNVHLPLLPTRNKWLGGLKSGMSISKNACPILLKRAVVASVLLYVPGAAPASPTGSL